MHSGGCSENDISNGPPSHGPLPGAISPAIFTFIFVVHIKVATWDTTQQSWRASHVLFPTAAAIVFAADRPTIHKHSTPVANLLPDETRICFPSKTIMLDLDQTNAKTA
jgi:hypothetical protein